MSDVLGNYVERQRSTGAYDERWNGVQTGVLHHRHHFGTMGISPYVVPGDPTTIHPPRLLHLTPAASLAAQWKNDFSFSRSRSDSACC